MKREVIDVTLPGKTREKGHRHPNQIALEEFRRVFIGMGYEVVEGPEVEYDNTTLEIKYPSKPSCKMGQDTFYIQQRYRVKNTSPVQSSYHGSRKMPIRMIAPGQVFILVKLMQHILIFPSGRRISCR